MTRILKRTERMISLLTAAALALAAAGCSGEDGGGGPKAEYITLAQLPEDIEKAKSGSYQVLKLSEGLEVNIPEKLTGLHLYPRRFTKEEADRLADFHGFTGKAVFSENSDPDDPYLINCNDENYSFILEKSGYMNIRYDNGRLSRGSEPADTEPYHVFVKDITPEDTVTVNGITGSLEKLVKEAEAKVNAHGAAAGDPSRYDPVFVYCEPTRVSVGFSKNIFGYALPCYFAQIEFNSTDPVSAGLKGAGSHCSVFFRQPDQVYGITDSRVGIEESGESFDKLLSLTSALKLADSFLSEEMELIIDDISIIQIDTKAEITVFEKGDTVDFEALARLEGYTRPCWQLLMHSSRSSEEYYAVLADCATAEIWFSKIALI